MAGDADQRAVKISAGKTFGVNLNDHWPSFGLHLLGVLIMFGVGVF